MNLRNPAALAAFARGDLENAVLASTPGGIEAQEAAGQAALVASGAQLPKEIHGATREQLEVIGFKFGADIDDLFVSVTLPPGWKLKATEHSMHNDLLDQTGAKRAGLFYKAAFYDRKADLHFSSRYFVRNDYAKPTCTISVIDSKTGEVIHVVGSCEYGAWNAMHELEDKGTVWLKEQFPEYRNALAYWS